VGQGPGVRVQNKACTQVKDSYQHKTASQATFNYFSGHTIFTGLDWTALWLPHRAKLGKLCLEMDFMCCVYAADCSKKVPTKGNYQRQPTGIAPGQVNLFF